MRGFSEIPYQPLYLTPIRKIYAELNGPNTLYSDGVDIGAGASGDSAVARHHLPHPHRGAQEHQAFQDRRDQAINA